MDKKSRQEDIENEWNFYFAKGEYTYHFWINKIKRNRILISKCEYSCAFLSSGYKELFSMPATKENYKKACEMVRDLFKGEK